MLITNGRRKLFFAERARSPGVWQFPQGGVEHGLSPEESAVKEAHEELGVPKERFEVLGRLAAVNEYEFDQTPPRWEGKYRGQSQTFWILRYNGTDEEIDLERCDQELMSWKWCTIAEIIQLAEPKRLRGYRAALAELEERLEHLE